MATCEFEVETTGPIVEGKQVTIRLKPALEHPCRFVVFANGLEAKVADCGSFQVNGVGGSGSVTITPTMDHPWGSIHFEITCPDCVQSITFAMPGGTEPPPPFFDPYRPSDRPIPPEIFDDDDQYKYPDWPYGRPFNRDRYVDPPDGWFRWRW